jgi:hypothetical protein
LNRNCVKFLRSNTSITEIFSLWFKVYLYNMFQALTGSSPCNSGNWKIYSRSGA